MLRAALRRTARGGGAARRGCPPAAARRPPPPQWAVVSAVAPLSQCRAASSVSPASSSGMLTTVKVYAGDRVVLPEPLQTDSFTQVTVPKETRGIIVAIDKQGDAMIDFDGIPLLQWVSKDNLSRVCKTERKPALPIRDDWQPDMRVDPGSGEKQPKEWFLKAYGEKGGTAMWESLEMAESKKDQWKMTLRIGQNITITRDGKSCSKEPIHLTKGMKGVVLEVNSYGDALIDFEGVDKLHWVCDLAWRHGMQVEERKWDEGKKGYDKARVKREFSSAEAKNKFYAKNRPKHMGGKKMLPLTARARSREEPEFRGVLMAGVASVAASA